MKKTPIKVLSTISIIGLSTITLGQYHDAQAATGEKPQIKAPEQQVQYGKKWNPYENVTATDKEDGNLNNEVYYDPPYFTTTQPGTYHVKYGVWDTDDNNTETNRNVTVLPKDTSSSQSPSQPKHDSQQGGSSAPSKPEHDSTSSNTEHHTTPSDSIQQGEQTHSQQQPSTEDTQPSHSSPKEADAGYNHDGQGHAINPQPTHESNIDNGYNHDAQGQPIQSQQDKKQSVDDGYNHDEQGQSIQPSQSQNDNQQNVIHHRSQTQNNGNTASTSNNMNSQQQPSTSVNPATQAHTTTPKKNNNGKHTFVSHNNHNAEKTQKSLPESGENDNQDSVELGIVASILGSLAVAFGIKRRQSKQN
ncbi:immunoglobulin-like domain-containing protein [Staphylococcus epidermidis]|uniref:immunoglobulin-like domain-containing protein n=1 Tax=Staphylococcus epidermidis TaxID=1282 RepID=UPI001F4E6748|nr:immunoglobulin-like domain-containing protein [Staphylococcus epidermidis]MCH9587721.1 DUF5011 domain-containing protein [Staphylococcus epidermidis]